MNKPIIDPSTLSEEQREAIRTRYALAKIQAEVLHYTTYDVMKELEEIFGKETFNTNNDNDPETTEETRDRT